MSEHAQLRLRRGRARGAHESEAGRRGRDDLRKRTVLQRILEGIAGALRREPADRVGRVLGQRERLLGLERGAAPLCKFADKLLRETAIAEVHAEIDGALAELER